MIMDLLNWSRVSMGEGTFARVDLGAVLRATHEGFAEDLAEAGATLDIGEMPTLRADASQMARLFQNLIANALKFRGSGPLRIRIEARRDGDQWLIDVADNGIGFPPEHRERIFAVFARLHDRELYPGTGMGLALCRRIAERHGGSIAADSRPGAGSTFTVALPAPEETAQ